MSDGECTHHGWIMRGRLRLVLLVLIGVFMLVLSPSALGDESTYQLVSPWGACQGFTVETVAGAVNGCTPLPPGMYLLPGEGITLMPWYYSAAANGSIVLMADDNRDPTSGDQGSIWLVKPDGSSLHLDSNPWDFAPSISYDGSKVVFARFDPATSSSDIYSVNADGSDLHLVVSGRGTEHLTVPSISPDGSAIAYWCGPVSVFTAPAVCGPLTDGSYRTSGVMRVGIDGTKPRMIAIATGAEFGQDGPAALSWSPDSRWLTTDGMLGDNSGTQLQLFKYRTDGSDLFNNLDPTRQITHAVAPSAPVLPQFSPDGSEILYLDSADGHGNQGNFSFLIGVDGSNPHQVSLNPDTTCANGSCDPPSYGEFIPTNGTPAPPPALVDATHVKVPSVTHQTLPAATSTLKAAHTRVGTVQRASSSQVPAGRVISQNPTAGATAHRTTKQGPPVALVVSTGLTRTVTVAKKGVGSGTVTSTPVGIACGSTCTHAFAKGISVKLVATAASGSVFSGWSGACTGTGVCRVAMSQARAVSAAFRKAVCVVPNVKGKLLASAKAALKAASCGTGTVSNAYSSTVPAGYVISESPTAGSKLAVGAKIALVVSKGPAG